MPRAQVASLDGIRGLAIIAVVFYHVEGLLPKYTVLEKTLCGFAMWGWLGVDLFFVLSGYLITGILLDSRNATNYYSSFYGRRMLRIMPLYCVVVLALYLLAPVWPNLSIPTRDQFWLYALYLGNLIPLFGVAITSSMAHFWTLAVEEQFYVVWPQITRRMSIRGLTRLCVALLVAAPIARGMLVWVYGPSVAIAYFTFTRMDGIVAGALLTLLKFQRYPLRRLETPYILAGAASIAVVFVHFYPSPELSWHVQVIGFSVIPICFAGIVAGAADGRWKALENPVLRSFGKYSYGIYVLHMPLLSGAQRFVISSVKASDHALPRYAVVAGCVAVFYLAGRMSHSFESLFLNLKPRFAPKTNRKDNSEQSLPTYTCQIAS